MKRLYGAVILILVMLMLSACKASTTTLSFFHSPADDVAELIQQQRYADADAVYSDNAAWFLEQVDDEEVSALLADLAGHLREGRIPTLNRAMSAVKAVEASAPPESWADIRSDFAALSSELDRIEAVALFKNPRYHVAEADAASDLLKAKKQAFVGQASTAFSRYDLTGAPDFFTAYPVDLNASVFLAENHDQWTTELEAADASGFGSFCTIYASRLTPESRSELARGYFDKLCPKAGKSELGTLMTGYARVVEAGLPLKFIPGVQVAFMDVSSKTLKKKGAIEFPIAVKKDLPFKTVDGSLKKGFASKALKSVDIIILINVAATRTKRNVDTSKYVKSTRLARYNKVPNPDWDVLQVELQQANIELMTLNTEKKDTDTDNPYTNLGNALSNWGNESERDEIKDKIKGLTVKFKKTPRYVDEPVYAEYQYQRVDMESLKSGSVQYYVIDQRNKTYFSDYFDVQSKEFFTVAYGLAEKDPNLEKHRATSVSEKVVDSFETKPVTVKLSELMGHYGRHAGQAKRYSSLAAVRQDVIKNRNVALAEVKDDEYGFDKREDKRFESVVVVRNATSLGTGFYVQDDVVLTNYHVVGEQKFIELKKWDEVETFGKVIAKDVRLDLALIKVQDRGTPVHFYGGKKLRIGDTVEAIGHPHGTEFSLTRGVVSAIREHETITGVKGKPILFVQTDSPINPGNSGGPLFDGDYVIGVNDWGFSKQIAEGLNFSIHYSEVFHFLDDNSIHYVKGGK